MKRATSSAYIEKKSRCPFLTLDKKLRVTARSLQSWSAKHVGHIRTQLAGAISEHSYLPFLLLSSSVLPRSCWVLSGVEPLSAAAHVEQWMGKGRWRRGGGGRGLLWRFVIGEVAGYGDLSTTSVLLNITCSVHLPKLWSFYMTLSPMPWRPRYDAILSS